MRRLWLFLALLVAAAAINVTLIEIPSGSSYGVVNDVIQGSFLTNVSVADDVPLYLVAVGDKKLPDISPNPIIFRAGQTFANFTITGRSPGRFQIGCKIMPFTPSNNQTMYKLTQDNFVVFVLNNQWPTVFIQMGFNTVLLILGLSYFAWRRHTKVDLPFWGGHSEGLFEQAPYRTDNPESSGDPLYAETMQERAKLFWNLRCDDNILVERCGAEAALCLRFLKDAGHLFVVLCLCSFALLLPINYVSGGARTQAYQEATISNVPIGSNWFWGHVAMCYIVAFAIFYFISRQYKLLAKLHKEDTTLIGPRTVFIQAGLPQYFTKAKLLTLFENDYPNDIDFVHVVDDLSEVYHILGQRMALRNESSRLEHIYSSQKVPGCLIWCPGNSFLPSPTDIFYDYSAGLPCRRKKEKIATVDNVSPPMDQTLTEEGAENIPPRVRRRMQVIHEHLEAYPDEIIANYKHRTGTGAAFVVFRSSATKNVFLERFLLTQSTSTKLRAQMSASCFRMNQSIRRKSQAPPSPLPSRDSDQIPSCSPLQKYLPSLIIQPAPEPNDIRWTNLISRPRSLKRMLLLGLYQLVTMVILILFSTPASVLLYINLDPSSPLYNQLLKENTVISGFIHSYLPTLLLVTVNSLLLVILFYLSIFEPWLTETKRMRSLLIKAFVYLLLSSILFPSIGVTAVYAAGKKVTQLSFESSRVKGNSYINDFLFNVCSNFFILYVAQLICIGTILQIMRTAERAFYQPWMRSRAVTPVEIQEALRPAPFYFGIEYALILSVVMITLLGLTLSPALVPCGALYFYVKFLATKYNFLYVHPKTPGRGHVTRSVLSLTLFCLILFEMSMSLILSQVARREHWLAVLFLTMVTVVIFAWWHLTVHQALDEEHRQWEPAERVNQALDIELQPLEPSARTPPRPHSPSALNVVLEAHSHQEIWQAPVPAYQNPYDAGLKMMYALSSHNIQKRQKLRYAFELWKKLEKPVDKE
ncbi:Aste57867_21217 [Aphanomyces stellatus]|uniref:Aste57867_21217 protein n=1 Tax=Aphanomyces stellatus TaxID=120398 RepID=A0A485LI83_9STRA|nr:hypothetical protein As57867_021149 [Aphanomyces stellatus]VFT97889.1 Aste57867_21217 [Aphanomyces stellatus]